MKQCYTPIKFKKASVELLDYIHTVVEKYAAMGLKLTLRQLYYQLVTANMVKNEEKSYKRVGGLVSDARLGGELDWSTIEDRVRVPKKPPQYDSLKDLVEAALWSYRLPRLAGQPTYVELWVEKDALAGVLAPIASQFHTTLMVNRGYSSQSAMYDAAGRICRACYDSEDGTLDVFDAVILYLGDFDPSGEDMVRDIKERLDLFLEGEDPDCGVSGRRENPYGVDVEFVGRPNLDVRKIALTMEQIDKYNPPPNPAKMSDSRARAFVDKHGSSSWEVDALPPEVLQQIIRDNLNQVIDMEKMRRIMAKEDEDKAELRSAVADIMRRKG